MGLPLTMPPRAPSPAARSNSAAPSWTSEATTWATGIRRSEWGLQRSAIQEL